MCNGFADECQPGVIVGKYSCKCQYNTAGERCRRCKSGYVQHKWRPRGAGNENFQCESKCILLYGVGVGVLYGVLLMLN